MKGHACRARRRMLGALLIAAVAACTTLLVVSGGSAAPPTVKAPAADAAAGAGQPPVKADRDGDKVFDDLEARLSAMAPSDRLTVLVALTSPATASRVADLSQRVGGFETRRRFAIADGFSATLAKRQVEALARIPTVAHVEENSPVHASNDTAQSSFGVTKARIDAPALDGDGDGASTYSRDDLVAAVVDSGIYAGHLDLDEGKVIAFKDFVNGQTTPYDDNGHGTHVAATIAGDGDARADQLHKGVAPAGALVGVKVLDAAGDGTMETVAAAIDWVVQNKDVYGIEVINLSLGAAGCSDGTDLASQAVNNAHAAGLVTAVAAGNEGAGTCTIGAPAAAANALTVGAMADLGAGGFSQAPFSSRGATADGRIKPDVSAPGVEITSAQTNTTDGYVSYSGTSMATPFVAGVALLMRDANAALTPQDVKDRLVATAVDWGRGGDNKAAGTTGRDVDYGAGRLDAYAALKAAGASITSPPAAPVHRLLEGTISSTGTAANYKLDVADLSFPLAATLIVPSITAATAQSPDLDLYLYDPAGALVAASETLNRQETVRYRPTSTGTYTLRVYSYSGGAGYFADVSGGLAVDTTPPSVTSVGPADRATGVAISTNVTVAFSEAMNSGSAQSAFSLVRSSDGAAVAGVFSWNGSTLTFNPTVDLAYGTSYTARVTTSAKDVAGNALVAEKIWTFTTAAAVTTVTAVPFATVVQTGSLRSGDAARLASDDETFYQVSSTTTSAFTSGWYGRLSGISNSLRSLAVTYRGKNSRSCTQTLWILRWTDNVWVRIDSRTVGTTETEVKVSPVGALTDYVSGSTGDGEVRIRVRCSTTYGTFFASGELLKVTFTK